MDQIFGLAPTLEALRARRRPIHKILIASGANPARLSELIEAALSLFVEKGFAATRVEEVAARAGVSKGTLFLYFPSKEDLFKAVVRETVAGRFPEWADELAEFQGDSVELVRYAMHTWWERVGMTPALVIATPPSAVARQPSISSRREYSAPTWPARPWYERSARRFSELETLR